MSISVLTTLIAVTVPPPAVGVADLATPAMVAQAAASVDPSPLIILAQPTTSAAPQSSEPAEPADPVQPTDPALAPQPESQVLPPPMDQSDIVVTGRRPSPDDPLAQLNATSFEVTQKVDDAIVAPIAFAYEDVMPRPIRQGLRNFLHNLGSPIVFLNYMLQLKPGKAAETVGRFAINTTIGAAGLVDVAKRKPFNLPYRHNGFANTLGYYGVKPGPYFYLPLIGSTTLRDFIGDRLDLFLLPALLGGPFRRPEFAIPVGVMKELDARVEFDDELREIRATRDPYVAARSYYLRRRQAEIDALHGRGDGTVPVIAPPTPSSDSSSSSAPPAPAQNPTASSVTQR